MSAQTTKFKVQTGIDCNEQIQVNQRRKIQSTKQVSIRMKKIGQHKVQRRCVVLKFTQVKFP